MKRLAIVALGVAGVFPVLAQHSGARGGGSTQGIAAAAVVRGGGVPSTRAGSPELNSTQGTAQLRFGMGAPLPGLAAGGLPAGGHAPAPVGRDLHAGHSEHRLEEGRGHKESDSVSHYGAVSTYGLGGWIAPVSLVYVDPSFYFESPSIAPVVSAPPVNESVTQQNAVEVQEAEVVAPPGYRRSYERPMPPPPELGTEGAVKLVYKDGRPSEDIHNYMLTRTTVYVQDEHRREIAVDDLDLEAIQKANKDAGVDFRLPGGVR
jgi:hypothetical protein